jgi:O-antigen/teichoic acid export membrane protein
MDLVFMATAPFISAFGEAKARNDWKWIRGAYTNATTASLAFGLPLLAIMSFFAKPIIRVWAGAAATPSTTLILGLAAYTVLGIALMAAGQLLIGLEHVNALALSLTLCSLGIIGSSILVAPRWGLTGIALCMAGSKVVTYWPIQIREVRRIFRASQIPIRETIAEPIVR